MAKLGQYDYPDVRISRVLDVVSKLCHPPHKGEISRTGLGEVLDLNIKGGAFAALLASMKDYALAEGRDQLKVTDLGKKAVIGSTDEREQARAQAFLNVPLFKELLERTGPTIPDGEEFSLVLKEITREDPLKVNNQYRELLGVYSDGIKLLGALKKPEMGGTVSTPPDMIVSSAREGVLFIEIKAGQYYQRLPYDANGFDIAVRFLQGLRDAQAQKQQQAQS